MIFLKNQCVIFFQVVRNILTLPIKPLPKEFDVSKFEEIKDWIFVYPIHLTYSLVK